MNSEIETSTTVITPSRFTLLLLSPILLYLLFMVWGAFSSRYGVQVYRDERVTIQLIPSDHPKQLIYETEQVRIQIGYDYFVDYGERLLRGEYEEPEFQKRMQEEPGFREAIIRPYTEWITSIQEQFEDKDEVILDIGADQRFVINMLEAGRASVYDKRTRREVQVIRMDAYEYTCGGLCGSGHQYFYLPTRMLREGWVLFYEARIWVS